MKYNEYFECVTEMAIDIGMMLCDDETAQDLELIDLRDFQMKIVEEWADEFLKKHENYEFVADYCEKVWEFTKEKALEYAKEY